MEGCLHCQVLEWLRWQSSTWFKLRKT